MFRRNGRRRRTFRRKALFRRRGGKYIRRTVRRTVRSMAETKFYIQNITAQLIYTAGIANGFADGLSQGVLPNQRVGTRISVQRLSTKLNFYFLAGTNGSTYAIVRVLILYPRKGVSGAQAAVVASAQNLFSRPDPTQVVVLQDRRFAVGTATTLGSGSTPSFKFFTWVKRTKFDFNYTGVQIDREPLIFMISALGQDDPSTVRCSGYLSMSFKDM